MLKIYLSNHLNPYENLALEEAIFKRKEEALLLWVNEASVIIGANQHVLNEVNLDYIQSKNIHLVRRKSGGGAVYHDTGNLNFSFFTKSLNKEACLKIILSALKKFEIEAELGGRNDLLYKGQKISGSAYYKEDDFYLFHGTLMVDVNLDELEASLHHRPIKYAKKGISSLKSRVINLSQLSFSLSVSLLKEAIIEEVKKLEDYQYASISYDQEVVHSLMKKDYLYDFYHEDALHFEYKTNMALYDFYLELENKMIQKIQIYSDDLELNRIEDLKKALLNKPFSQFEKILKMNLE